MMPCTLCPPGRTTSYVSGDGQYQDALDDCLVPPGYGVYDQDAQDPFNPPVRRSSMIARPCPIGFFSTGELPKDGNETALHRTTTNPTCKRCPAGLSTLFEGSTRCDGEQHC